MAVKTSIGKNTLGGGSKMDVYMKDYSSSTHDLSYTWRNTQAPGTLVPFMCEVALPGDTWYIKLRTQMLTHPTLGPLFGSFKQQNDIFLCPIRLYNALLHNNSLNIGMDISAVKLPQIEWTFQTENDNQYLEGSKGTLRKQIHPSSLLSTLGIKSIRGRESEGKLKKNATALIAYYDIFKNYYANKQETKFPTIGNAATVEMNLMYAWAFGTVNGNITAATNSLTWDGINSAKNYVGINKSNTFEITKDTICYLKVTNFKIGGESLDITLDPAKYKQEFVYNNKTYLLWDVGFTTTTEDDYQLISIKTTEKNYIATWNLTDIDDMREYILAKGKQQITISENYPLIPALYRQFQQRTTDGFLKTSNVQFGLALKTYQSDIFTNWVQTEWIDGDNGVNAITAIDTSAGNFSLDTLNLSQKVYDMLNRIAISDGSYNSWIRTVYTSGGVPHYETPVYMGGSSSEIEFQEVVSNAATYDQPLGSLAGRGVDTRHKGGEIKIKVDEPCYILGITSITPRVDYFQGNRFDTDFETLNDLHKPALDGIGFQDRLYQTLNAQVDSLTGLGKSIGKQPAWIDYMTNYNRTFGNFAILENEGWMCLNRVFKNIDSYTTYINPQEYNGIFADTDLDAMNFWSQIHVDAKVRRVMSAKQIPNL